MGFIEKIYWFVTGVFFLAALIKGYYGIAIIFKYGVFSAIDWGVSLFFIVLCVLLRFLFIMMAKENGEEINWWKP